MFANKVSLNMQIKLQTELGGEYVYIRHTRMPMHKHNDTAVLNRIEA